MLLLLQRKPALSTSQHHRGYSIEIGDLACWQGSCQTSELAEDADVRPLSDTAASPSSSLQVHYETEDQPKMREEWAATYIQTAFRGFLVQYFWMHSK